MKSIFSLLIIVSSLISASASAGLIVQAKANSISGGAGGSTGIFFNAGDYFTASADVNDLWNAGALPRWSNADGLNSNLYATGSDESGERAGTLIGRDFGLFSRYGLSAAYGSLVGSIDGNYFLMGTNYAGNAVGTGELLLWYWDSNSGDNSELINVEINTVSVSEPATLALIGLALAGLGYSRRKS